MCIRDSFDAIAAEIAARSRALAARSMMWAGSAYGDGARERMDILLPPGLRAGAPIHMFCLLYTSRCV